MAGLLVAGFSLRAPLSVVGPVLPAIRADLHLDPVLAGLTGTIPVVCFSLFAFATPFLVARLGAERTFGVALALLAVALVLRVTGGAGLFFVGTALAGTGIAIANVVPPGVIRARFPTRVATLSALNVVVMNAGSAVGSAAAVPVADAGLGWRGSLAVWAAPAASALVVWTFAARAVLADDRGHSRTAPPPTGMGRVARHARPWVMAAFTGAQSAGIYFLFTWLATILQHHGLSPTTAGLLVGLISVLGIVGALAVVPVLERGHTLAAVAVLYPGYALGLALLALGPAPAVVGTVLCGLAQGASFTVVLTMIGRHADPDAVPATSALVQGGGYALAATAPFAAGALLGASGGWGVPVAFMTALMAVAVVLGIGLARTPLRANSG